MKNSPELLNKKQAGFTLLEALVALVIMAGALLPFYSGISTILNSAQTIADNNIRADATLNILEVGYWLNPMQQPQGTLVFGPEDQRISWQSQPLTETTENSGYPRGIGLHDMALYQVKFQAFQRQQQVAEISLIKVGYKKVRTLAIPGFSQPAAPSP
jgi:general secretion pathway protein I